MCVDTIEFVFVTMLHRGSVDNRKMLSTYALDVYNLGWGKPSLSRYKHYSKFQAQTINVGSIYNIKGTDLKIDHAKGRFIYYLN